MYITAMQYGNGREISPYYFDTYEPQVASVTTDNVSTPSCFIII